MDWLEWVLLLDLTTGYGFKIGGPCNELVEWEIKWSVVSVVDNPTTSSHESRLDRDDDWLHAARLRFRGPVEVELVLRIL